MGAQRHIDHLVVLPGTPLHTALGPDSQLGEFDAVQPMFEGPPGLWAPGTPKVRSGDKVKIAVEGFAEFFLQALQVGWSRCAAGCSTGPSPAHSMPESSETQLKNATGDGDYASAGNEKKYYFLFLFLLFLFLFFFRRTRLKEQSEKTEVARPESRDTEKFSSLFLQ